MCLLFMMIVFFFFQAEDGIRDLTVTGVQTCALPIYTINLQEQLVGKDLPILARALGTGDHTPSFALLKGWHNYLCLARLEQARAGLQTLFDEREAAELESLGAWAARTSDGSLADLDRKSVV